MTKYKSLETTQLNGDTIYNFGGLIPDILYPGPPPSPSPTPTPSNTPSPTPTPSITPSLTPTQTATPTLTPTPSITPSLTPTKTPTPTPTKTITPTPTLTPTPSSSPPPPGYNEADLYLNTIVANGAVGVDAGVSGATRTMFNQLFTQGLWTKLDAFWPFLGQVAATHKFNAKNPVDADSAFRLTFVGGWTHDANGITPDGITTDANTYIVPSSAMTLTDSSMGYYYSSTASTRSFPTEMGSSYFSEGITLSARMPGDNNFIGRLWGNWNVTGYATSAETGSLIISRTASNVLKLYRRGVLNYTNTGGAGTKTNTTGTIRIGSNFRVDSGNITERSDRNLRFAFVGKGLDDTEAGNLDAIIQNYQIALGRATY